MYRSPLREGEGTVLNVCETGLFVATPLLPDVGEHVSVDMKPSDRKISVKGIVTWAGERVDAVTGFGIRLVYPPVEFLELVACAIPESEAAGAGVRRTARRFHLQLPVGIQYGNMLDTGHLADVSLTGARLEGTRLRPGVGETITLALAVEGYRDELALQAFVVRSTESNGFGVRIQAVTEALSRNVAAVLHTLEKLPIIAE